MIDPVLLIILAAGFIGTAVYVVAMIRLYRSQRP